MRIHDQFRVNAEKEFNFESVGTFEELIDALLRGEFIGLSEKVGDTNMTAGEQQLMKLAHGLRNYADSMRTYEGDRRKLNPFIGYISDQQSLLRKTKKLFDSLPRIDTLVLKRGDTIPQILAKLVAYDGTVRGSRKEPYSPDELMMLVIHVAAKVRDIHGALLTLTGASGLRPSVANAVSYQIERLFVNEVGEEEK